MTDPLIVLVSTVQSVLAVDVHTGRYEVVDRGRGIYFGIARRDHARPIIGARRSGLVAEGRPSESAVLIELTSPGPDTNVIEAPVPLRDVHQVIDHRGDLFVVCSYDERVVIRTTDDRWLSWSPFPGSTADKHHVNSIRIEHGVIHLVAHNWDKPSQVRRYRLPEGGWPDPAGDDDVAEIELEYLGSTELGRMAHDIWLQPDGVVVSSSGEGLIRSSSGEEVFVGGFNRGLVVTPDRIVAGRSLNAERGRRATADAHLVVFDREWNHLRDILLPGEGMVMEVRAPGLIDECDGHHDDEPWTFTERGGWNRLPVKVGARV